jgi:hypothetical protein
MKDLFLSQDAVIAREYRHGRAYRIAALTILAFAVFQLAAIAGVIYCWHSEQELNDQSTQIAGKAAELNTLEASLKDLRQKLDRIRLWTPILARRIPVSSLLAAIETAIPREVELDKLMIETDASENLTVHGGTYRVPGEYRVSLFGLLKTAKASAQFQQRLHNVFPPGSEVSIEPFNSQDANGLLRFEITARIKPNGNYQPLGLKKIMSDTQR